MQQIDVEQIMNEIRKEIKEKGIEEQLTPFRDLYETELPFAIPSEFSMDELHNETVNAMALYDTAIQPIHQVSGIKGMIKKLLNKAAYFSMNTHMVSQNTFNIAVVNALLQVNALAEDNRKMQEEIDELKKELDQFKTHNHK